ALDTAGDRQLGVTDTDTASVTGTTTVHVNPTAATSFAVVAFGGAPAGTVVPVFVVAKDSFDNMATGYRGTVRFTSSDAQATLPPAYTFVAAVQGSHSFSATLRTAGDQTVTVTDFPFSGQVTLLVLPAAADHLVLGAPKGALAGVPVRVLVTAQDHF